MSFQSSQETQKNKMTKDEINRKVGFLFYILESNFYVPSLHPAGKNS